MLRKIASALAVAFAVTLASASSANAAPYEPATFSVVDIGVPGGDYQVSGSGFGDDVADDFVTITLTYGSAPQGLRAAPGLAAAVKADSYTADVDSDGNFSTVVYATQDGPVYFTVVGSPSGESISGQLVAGTSGSGVTTTTAGVASGSSGGYYSSGSGSSSGSQGAYNSDYAATGGYSSGSNLASTGASIAGPMAIGLGTLTVGLGLLFFGTRGVIRRGARTARNN